MITHVRLNVEFDSGNAAIVDSPVVATQAVLASIINALDNHRLDGVCKDHNGNSIGFWSLDIENDGE